MSFNKHGQENIHMHAYSNLAPIPIVGNYIDRDWKITNMCESSGNVIL